MSGSTYLYVGSYTRPATLHPANIGSSISVYHFDLATGGLTYSSAVSGIINPSYLNFDSPKRHLYAISEVQERSGGFVTAYAVDPKTGALTYLNKQPSRGQLTCYVTVDHTNRWVLIANYGDGSIAIMPIRSDGRIGEVTDRVRHQGSNAVPGRPPGPHPHCVVIDPTNSYAFVADLGLDKIVGYRLDLETGRFIPNDATDLETGAGPRHLIFHPNHKFAYVIQETNSAISALEFDSKTATLHALQTVAALPEGSHGIKSHCADIHITPNGKFLYGSNRGHDSIVVHAIDQQTGRLAYIGHEPTQGKTPRSFVIDTTGTYLLVANQESDSVVTFRIDQNNGKLLSMEQVTNVPTPACLKMLTLD